MTRKRHLDADSPNTSAAPMTLDEYYAMRAAEEQDQYYLQGSRNRKESHRAFITKPYTKEDEEGDRRFINYHSNVLGNRTYMSDAEIQDRINNGTLLGVEQISQNKEEDLSKEINDAANRLHNKQPVVDYAAFNCIATATSNNPNKGHYVISNQVFAANPTKYGFKKVNKDEAKPGSLVQAVNNGVPYHAMILNSRNENTERYNYSPGNYPNYKVNGRYLIGPSERLDYYNFVGNEADSARWKNEYEQRYRQKYGGCIPRRALATGGTITLPTLVVTPSKHIANNALLHYARTDLQNAIMDRLLSNFKGYATLRRTLASKKNIDLNKPLFT